MKLRILLLIISIIFAGCLQLPDNNTIKIIKLNVTEFNRGVEFTVKNNLCNYSVYEIVVKSNGPGEIFVKFCEKSKSNWSCTYLKKYLGLPIPGDGRSPTHVKLYTDILKRNESLTVNISGEFKTFDPKNVEITIMVKQECIQKPPPPPPSPPPSS